MPAARAMSDSRAARRRTALRLVRVDAMRIVSCGRSPVNIRLSISLPTSLSAGSAATRL